MGYRVSFKQLNLGVNRLNFLIGDDFFKKFEYTELSKGNINIECNIDYQVSSVSFNFIITGEVEVQCDICLEYFLYKIDSKEDLFIRFSDRLEGDEEFFEGDNKITLPKSQDFIDLDKHFYDFIVLSLPIKKVHPLDKNGNRTCNPEILKKLEEYKPKQKLNDDPKWDEIKKLLN